MTSLLKKALLLVALACAQIAQAQTANDGLSAMQLEQWDKAISIYTAITKANPGDQDAWLSLSNAYMAKKQQDKAVEALNGAFAANAESGFGDVVNARRLLMQNNTAQAEDQLARAAKHGKKQPAVLRQRGETYTYFLTPNSDKHNYARAEQLLKEAVDANPKDFQTLMAYAFNYKEMGNGGLAVQQYEQAAALQPKDPLPLTMIGRVYRSAKVANKDQEYFDRALGLDSKYTPALRSKAEAFYAARKWEKAAESYRNLINMGGSDIAIEDEMQYANVLFIVKDCKGVSEMVEKILKKDGSKNYLRRLQGYCDYENGEYQRGLTLLNDYFKSVTPDKIISSDYEYRAKLTVKVQGDTAMAISDYRKAIEMDSSIWPLHKDISNLYYSQRDYCQSAAEYQMYIDSLEKPSANDYQALGIRHFYCREDSMHFQKALDAFTKVTVAAPTYAPAFIFAGRSASRLEPDVTGETDPEKLKLLVADFGKAKPFFEKYVELVGASTGADLEKNKKDLITAYEYLSYYYFLKTQDAEARAAIAKLLELDAANETGGELLKQLNNGGAPKAPKTPGGGGKG